MPNKSCNKNWIKKVTNNGGGALKGFIKRSNGNTNTIQISHGNKWTGG